MRTRGVVYVHSTPLAVCPHVEWALARVLGTPVRLDWASQPIEPGARRADYVWAGRPGTGSDLAGALKQWPMLRFEITEEPSPGYDGERYMHVPGRGLFRAAVSVTGDLMLSENQVRGVLATARGSEAMAHALGRLLGTAWDAELEPYRVAGEGAPATWLTQAG